MNILKISFFIIVSQLAFAGIHAQAPASSRSDRELKYSNVHIGLVYPLSTNGVKAREYNNSFSLHAIAGVSGGETGIALSGFSLFIKDSASGLQCSGFMNLIGNKAHGVQLAGFMNNTRNKAQGLQAAGFLNLTGSSKGLALAGFGNISRDSAEVQLAGFINKSGNAGFQAAGFINKADNSSGQVAGFINIAKKVRGVQLAGFINIADSSEYPIALVNIIGNGERSIGVSTDETFTNLLTFRSGSRKLYGILGIGYNGKDHKDLYALEAGLGAHLNIARNFRINTELVTVTMTDFKPGSYLRGTFRALPALHLGPHIEIFAGPDFNYIRSEKGRGIALVNHYTWSEKEGSGTFHGLYFGATGGLQVNF